MDKNEIFELVIREMTETALLERRKNCAEEEKKLYQEAAALSKQRQDILAKLIEPERLAEGKNEVEIIGWMTERYGDFVRYNPPLTGQTLVLWALPVVLLLLMALILWRVRAKR